MWTQSLSQLQSGTCSSCDSTTSVRMIQTANIRLSKFKIIQKTCQEIPYGCFRGIKFALPELRCCLQLAACQIKVVQLRVKTGDSEISFLNIYLHLLCKDIPLEYFPLLSTRVQQSPLACLYSTEFGCRELRQPHWGALLCYHSLCYL